jgi:hypothetical protein
MLRRRWTVRAKKTQRKPRITIYAFHELTETEQEAVRRFFFTFRPNAEFEEFNYSRAPDGAVEWLDIKTIWPGSP